MQIGDPVFIKALGDGALVYSEDSDARDSLRRRGVPLLVDLYGLVVEWRDLEELNALYEHPDDWLEKYRLVPFASDKAGGTWGFLADGSVAIFDTGDLALKVYARDFSEFLFVAFMLGTSAVAAESVEGASQKVQGMLGLLARYVPTPLLNVAGAWVEGADIAVDMEGRSSPLVSFGRIADAAEAVRTALKWDGFMHMFDPTTGDSWGVGDVDDIVPR